MEPIMNDRSPNLQARVTKAAGQLLNQQGYVSPLDVMIALGWLQRIHAQDWRHGKVPFLERVIQTNLHKLTEAMKYLKQWALSSGLKPSQTVYMSYGRSKIKLTFSKSGNPRIEQEYSTHYISPILSEKKIARLQNKWEQSPDLVVFCLVNDSQCSKCHTELHKGSFLLKDGDDALCMNCCQLGDLVFLPSGNAALTRKSKNYSNKHAVVVKFSRTRNRYERQGMMVEAEALKKAEREMGIE